MRHYIYCKCEDNSIFSVCLWCSKESDIWKRQITRLCIGTSSTMTNFYCKRKLKACNPLYGRSACDGCPLASGRDAGRDNGDGGFYHAPLEETDVFMPMGLRASYDHIDRYSYDQGGKRMRLSIGINTAGFVLSAGRRRN